MTELTLVGRHQNALIALAVHAFTASGIVLAMLAAFAAYNLDWPAFFMWLGLALVVDGISGCMHHLADTTKFSNVFSTFIRA